MAKRKDVSQSVGTAATVKHSLATFKTDWAKYQSAREDADKTSRTAGDSATLLLGKCAADLAIFGGENEIQTAVWPLFGGNKPTKTQANDRSQLKTFALAEIKAKGVFGRVFNGIKGNEHVTRAVSRQCVLSALSAFVRKDASEKRAIAIGVEKQRLLEGTKKRDGGEAAPETLAKRMFGMAAKLRKPAACKVIQRALVEAFPKAFTDKTKAAVLAR